MSEPSTPRSRKSESSISSSTSTLSTAPTTTSTYSTTRRPSLGLSMLLHGQSKQPVGQEQSTSDQRTDFTCLPTEVLMCILQQLRSIHAVPSLLSCSNCLSRDMYNLALVNRTWRQVIKNGLYENIELDGPDSPAQLKRYKIQFGVRLKLLRRTLRERKALANTVRTLRVWDPESGQISIDKLDLIASVVMACPNLEALTGIHPVYDHTFSRLNHALSTRTKLKQHVWNIGQNVEITDRSYWRLPPGLMSSEQTFLFLSTHRSWRHLTTLILHARDGAILEHNVFVSLFPLIPALENLSVSCFDTDDFNDNTLLALPPLKSLRLVSLPGVTSTGLSSLTYPGLRDSLTSLSLISLPVASILSISKLLSSLSLQRFTLSQDISPSAPSDTVILPPLLASKSLQYLHWDVRTTQDAATPHLAASIFLGAFPSLCIIRAPSDPGTLQSLCAPRAQVASSSDRFLSAKGLHPSIENGLRAARLRAQARIEEAKKRLGVRIVISEEGAIRQNIEFRAWIGTVGSMRRYMLESDVGPGFERALAEEGDLLADGEGWPTGGCTGQWNSRHPKGKKWWTHVSRERWKGLDVGKLF